MNLKNTGEGTFDQLTADINKTKEITAQSLDTLSGRLKALTDAQSVAREVLQAQSDSISITEEDYKRLIEADAEYAKAVDTSSGYFAVNAETLNKINAEKNECFPLWRYYVW